MNYQYISTVIAVTLVIISGFVAYNNYNEKQLASLEKSLENATSRGINPLAVRCAYASSTDNICIVYAAKQAITVKE